MQEALYKIVVTETGTSSSHQQDAPNPSEELTFPDYETVLTGIQNIVRDRKEHILSIIVLRKSDPNGEREQWTELAILSDQNVKRKHNFAPIPTGFIHEGEILQWLINSGLARRSEDIKPTGSRLYQLEQLGCTVVDRIGEDELEVRITLPKGICRTLHRIRARRIFYELKQIRPTAVLEDTHS